MPTSPTDCELARESFSMQLDGELPEQDLDRLETHLRFCPDCSAWADQVRDVTLRLRDTCVDVPAGGFVLSRGTRRWRVGSAVALASAAAVVAAMLVAPGRHSGSVAFQVSGPPRWAAAYDVAAGIAYPPHSMLGSSTLAVSRPQLVSGPLRPL